MTDVNQNDTATDNAAPTEEKEACYCGHCDLMHRMGYKNEREFVHTFSKSLAEANNVALSDIFGDIGEKLEELVEAKTITEEEARKIHALVDAAIVEQLTWNAARLAQRFGVSIESFVGGAASLWVRAEPNPLASLGIKPQDVPELVKTLEGILNKTDAASSTEEDTDDDEGPEKDEDLREEGFEDESDQDSEDDEDDTTTEEKKD